MCCGIVTDLFSSSWFLTRFPKRKRKILILVFILLSETIYIHFPLWKSLEQPARRNKIGANSANPSVSPGCACQSRLRPERPEAVDRIGPIHPLHYYSDDHSTLLQVWRTVQSYSPANQNTAPFSSRPGVQSFPSTNQPAWRAQSSTVCRIHRPPTADQHINRPTTTTRRQASLRRASWRG